MLKLVFTEGASAKTQSFEIFQSYTNDSNVLELPEGLINKLIHFLKMPGLFKLSINEYNFFYLITEDEK